MKTTGPTPSDVADVYREILGDGVTPAEALDLTCVDFEGAFTRAEIVAILQPAATPAAAAKPHPTGGTPAPRRGPPWETVAALARTPYRFVPLNTVIVPPQPEALGPLNEPVKGGLCLEIAIDWRAETALLVGETAAGDKDRVSRPLKMGDDWVIPAASLRGMIRAVVEIAAFGRLSQVDGHLRFPLRDFEHPRYRASELAKPQVESVTPSPISDSSKVHSGWLSKAEDGRYAITPCGDKWGYVPKVELARAYSGFDVGKPLKDKYEKIAGKENWTAAVGRPVKLRRLETTHRDGVHHLFAPDPLGQHEGCLVLSGRAPSAEKKLYEYAFFDGLGSLPIPLMPAAWAQFELMNTRQGRTRREPEGSWADLSRVVEQGGRAPVFYVGDLVAQDAEFAFGLTRLFKIPHIYSVGDILDRSGPPEGAARRHGAPEGNRPAEAADFVETLFGYVFEPPAGAPVRSRKPADFARRGKVAFSFAHLPGDQFMERGRIDTVMAAPRASFAPFYLEGPIKDYSSRQSRLAGRKRYVARAGDTAKVEVRLTGAYNALQAERAGHQRQVEAQQKSPLRFLAPQGPDGGRFVSRIRLHNVTKAEAGAILWALDFGGRKDCRHLLGRAKAFGAGRLQAAEVSLTGEWNDTGEPVGQADTAALTAAFAAHIEAHVPAWEKSEPLQALVALADPSSAGADLDRPQPGREADGVTWLTPLKLNNEPVLGLDGQRTEDRPVNPFQQLRKVSGLRVPTKGNEGTAPSRGAPDRFLGLAPPKGRKD